MSTYIGRPKVYSKQIMFALKESDIVELDKLVELAGVSRSEYIRLIVVNHLKEKGRIKALTFKNYLIK